MYHTLDFGFIKRGRERLFLENIHLIRIENL